jgi:hypothetical protein
MTRSLEQVAMLLEGILGYRPGENRLRPLMVALREYDEIVRARGYSPDHVKPASSETQAVFVFIQQLYELGNNSKPAADPRRFLEQVAVARREYLERRRRADAMRRTAGRVAAGVAGLTVMAAMAGAAAATSERASVPAVVEELLDLLSAESAAGQAHAGGDD